MKKLFITFSTLALLLITFVACNDSDLPIEQSTQENVMELRSTGTDATHYYWFRGERIGLTVSKDYVHVIVNDKFRESADLSALFQTFNIEQNDNEPTQGIVRVRLTPEGSRFRSESALSEYLETVDALKQSGKISYVFPFFERGKGVPPIGTSYAFYVMLKTPEDKARLKEIAERHSVQIMKQIPYMPLWYILSVQGSGFRNSIEASNYFFETGYFSEIDPAFMFNFAPNCANDPDFNRQWGLRNTGQSGGRAGIDINVCSAWTITRGAGVNVAVLDTPIDPDHNDLRVNFHPLSFDAQSGSLPSCLIGTGHGTHVAGIIAAGKNNGLQVAGVAPESRIMRISHDLYRYDDQGVLNTQISAQLASGISWAWQNGADIINNSWGDWGGTHNDILRSAALENAIVNAMTQGRLRNGVRLGAIVIFASGNTGVIDYPAWFHPDILVVGAVDRHGRRSVFDFERSSGFGTQLDVVAPGSYILSTLPNNWVDYRSGTSMAAPMVAGVAALMLSVNPNLTARQVREIIKRTANREILSNYNFTTVASRPYGTWNERVGHGLVDAYAAVREAIAPGLYICGPCSIYGFDGVIFTVRNFPSGANIEWDQSSHLERISVSPSGGDRAMFRGVTSGSGWVRATVNGVQVTHPVQITIPLPSISGPNTINGFNNTVFTIQNFPPNANVVWSNSSNIYRVSFSHNTATFRVAAGATSGPGWVRATVNGAPLTHSVQVNVPPPPPRPTISGPNILCAGLTGTFSIPAIPQGTTVRWIADAPLAISGADNQRTVTVWHTGAPLSANSGIRVEVIMNGQVVHNVWRFVMVDEEPMIKSIFSPDIISSGAFTYFFVTHNGSSLWWSVYPDTGVIIYDWSRYQAWIYFPRPGPHTITAVASSVCGSASLNRTIVVTCPVCGNNTSTPNCWRCWGWGREAEEDDDEEEDEDSTE